MSLVEAMMAITIFSIGMIGFSMLFLNSWRTNSFALEMGRTSMAVSQGMGKMVNYIRGTRQADNGSYPVKSANDNDLVLYSDYDNDGDTERLHFYKSGSSVFLGVTDPSGTIPKSYQTGDQQVATIANSIVNLSTEPIFYYYGKDFAGDEVASPALATPASVSEIRLVKIHLKINIDPYHAPDNIELQSFVEMRNLNDYDRLK